jgi:hypothetical protein
MGIAGMMEISYTVSIAQLQSGAQHNNPTVNIFFFSSGQPGEVRF